MKRLTSCTKARVFELLFIFNHKLKLAQKFYQSEKLTVQEYGCNGADINGQGRPLLSVQGGLERSAELLRY